MKLSRLPWLSVVLFVVACFMPVLTFVKEGGGGAAPPVDEWSGMHALALGWLGIFVGNPAWFANLFWLAGSLFFIPNRGRIVALILCLLAVPVAFTAFSIIGQVIPADEGGVNKQRVLQFHAGAYVWLASLICQAAVAVLVASRRASAAEK
jgi:hypothetical protein